MKLIDTHCHLSSEKLLENTLSLLHRAQQAGVQNIINIATCPSTVDIVLNQLNLSELLLAAIGIQPHDANLFNVAEGEKIQKAALENKRVVAIGEIGLDAFYEKSPMNIQIECFEYFLQVAINVNKPVVIHVRGTHAEVFRLLNQYSKKGLRGVIHCFTGTLDQSKDFLDCGFYISFSGIVTFKNALDVQNVAKYIPNDKILIETDSPYLSPVPFRGKCNEPSHIAHTNLFLANLRGESKENMAKMTTENAQRCFGI